jgi:hypothetical protein
MATIKDINFYCFMLAIELWADCSDLWWWSFGQHKYVVMMLFLVNEIGVG